MIAKVTALLLYLCVSYHQRKYSRAGIPTTPGYDKCNVQVTEAERALARRNQQASVFPEVLSAIIGNLSNGLL